jgi:hypothetical protein
MKKILVVGTLGVTLQIATLSVAIPTQAQTASSAQEGDYYAPGATAVQQPTQAEVNEAKEGDYYAPNMTIVQQPTSQQLNRLRQGDYYAPTDK